MYSRILNARTRQFLLATVAGALLTACGGATFQQTQGVAKQRPLKYGTKVAFAETEDGLAQPTVVLGTLKSVTKHGEDDRPSVEKDFRLLAAGKGCDAVVGLKLDTTQTVTPTKVYHKNAEGKVEQVVEDVTTQTHTWSAQCVRSAEAEAPGDAKPAR